MRRVKTLAACLGAVIAIVAVAAANASAKAPALILKNEGAVVANGTAAIGELVMFVDGDSCTQTLRTGKVAVNSKSKDEALLLSAGAENSCSAGTEMKSTFHSVQLKSTGAVTVKGEAKISIELPGACVYEVKKLTGTATFPGFSSVEVSGSARLNKHASSPLCSSMTAMVEGEAELFDATSEALFETEVT